MESFWVLVLIVSISHSVSAIQRACNRDYEYTCDDGSCISSIQWCDGIVDCPSRYDEDYCDGRTPCPDELFPCQNDKCVPLSAICDGINTCGDHSDERNCSNNRPTMDGVEVAVGIENRVDKLAAAVVNATGYLLKQRNADHGWGAFTPRAVVAMSFANAISPIAENEKEFMKKQLNVQLLLDLMQNEENMGLSRLALYVNALLATCEDPRDFQGVNLVDLLRKATNSATQSNSSIPLAFLTLCLADDIDARDIAELNNMYYNQEFDRIGSKALIIMAMVCHRRQMVQDTFGRTIFEYFSQNTIEGTDIYTKALYMQALIAAGYKVDVEPLVSEQLPDGSFGDVLATYSVIPVLVNSSLLNLKCNTTVNTEMGLDLSARSEGDGRIVYSLWISSQSDSNRTHSHSLTLTFDGYKSFFDLMKMAAARDAMYRFSYYEEKDGKQAYSIGGIPNDPESGRSWILYSGSIGSVMENSLQNLKREHSGIDKIFPVNDTHFVHLFAQDIIPVN